MATTKTVTASASYIVTTNSTTVTYTPSVRADVDSTVIPLRISLSSADTVTAPSGVGLTPPIHMTKPGVFTQGTVPEGTLSNPTNDSNS